MHVWIILSGMKLRKSLWSASIISKGYVPTKLRQSSDAGSEAEWDTSDLVLPAIQGICTYLEWYCHPIDCARVVLDDSLRCDGSGKDQSEQRDFRVQKEERPDQYVKTTCYCVRRQSKVPVKH